MILDFDKAWKNMNYLHLLESANSLLFEAQKCSPISLKRLQKMQLQILQKQRFHKLFRISYSKRFQFWDCKKQIIFT